MTAGLFAPAQASAAITSVFGGKTVSGNPIPCTAQSDGVRVCHGSDGGGGPNDLRLATFDGAGALEVYVILPPAPSSGSDGPYPEIVQGHGWGGSAGGPNDTQFYGPTADSWAKNGYAVLQITARGFGDSCGKATPPSALGPCMNGYIRLDDDRYEVRDVQYASGLLVDEGAVNPGKIGVTGESYGGGLSLQLATLKDRVMNSEGKLHPWTSPNGTSMHIAAAAPVIPWSDLVYSLTPNGRTLDYQVTGPTDDLTVFGVPKESFTSGLYALGAATGTYAAPGQDPQADLTTWNADVQQGDPPNSQDAFITQQIAQFHSAYYLLDGAYGTATEAPPPLLIANGFTDDLFPVDEAVRYYNYEQAHYSSDPIALIDGDFGHMRAQNKSGDKSLLSSRIQSFFDYYVKGSGSAPQLGATALTETCPSSAPSGGPFTASTWTGLHPGEVDFSSKPAQNISSSAGDPLVAKTFDPVSGGGACATAPSTDQGSGVATYRLPRVTGSGYTLLGAPTVIATLTAQGSYPQIATRLLDVDPSSNTETLVARGLYRLDPNNPDGLQVFQLHPGAWHFAAGHIPKLELLGQDSPYGRANNESFSISVSGLELRVPVHEKPGSSRVVGPPKPH
jgi:hypothetical protein